MKSKNILWFVMLLVATGCTDGIYKYLGRPAVDPVIESPEVLSFSKANVVVIRWNADICADEYLLYRKKDAVGEQLVLIYRGTMTEYTDTDGSNAQRYIYSISKTRGQKELGPSDGVLGVFCSTIQDAAEPNNSKESAVRLESDIKANMYYYQDSTGNVIQDEDWYYVEVPARRSADIVIKQDDENVVNAFFYFSEEGEIPFQVVNGDSIAVENYTHSTKKIYFCLYPVAGEFINDIGQAGGAIVGYLIGLDKIINL